MDSCCVSGAIHEGTPSGTTNSFGGVTTYVALPEGSYDKTKALLYLPDAFGIELVNNKLLADAFAKNGFATYAIDLFNGDSVPADGLSTGKFDLGAWIPNHLQPVTRPYIETVIKELKAQGVTDFAATGYCFGGRYVVDLTLDGEIKVAAVAHPSLLKIPDDLEALKKSENAQKIPFLWNTCEKDGQFGPEAQAEADKIFSGDKNYKRNYYAGNQHGFGVRGDMSDPVVKAAKEDAFEETVKWFKAHL